MYLWVGIPIDFKMFKEKIHDCSQTTFPPHLACENRPERLQECSKFAQEISPASLLVHVNGLSNCVVKLVMQVILAWMAVGHSSLLSLASLS